MNPQQTITYFTVPILSFHSHFFLSLFSFCFVVLLFFTQISRKWQTSREELALELHPITALHTIHIAMRISSIFLRVFLLLFLFTINRKTIFCISKKVEKRESKERSTPFARRQSCGNVRQHEKSRGKGSKHSASPFFLNGRGAGERYRKAYYSHFNVFPSGYEI